MHLALEAGRVLGKRQACTNESSSLGPARSGSLVMGHFLMQKKVTRYERVTYDESLLDSKRVTRYEQVTY